MSNLPCITYGRVQLLLLGKKFLSTNTTHRLPRSTWVTVKSLGLQTARTTKRGKKAGKEKRKRLRSALLNAQSVCKSEKTILFNNFITSNELDVLFLTETWLHGDNRDNVILANLLPPDYKILQRARTNCRGGGVALVYRENLRVKLCTSKYYESFEHIVTKIVASSVIYHVVTIYRPPSNQKNHIPSSKFFEEFANFLTDVVLFKGDLLIVGDFNFPLNNKGCSDTRQFNNIIESYNLRQHVLAPTHKLGNTLDLLLTRASDSGVKHIEVKNHLLSDHFAVHFSLSISRPSRPIKTINYRNYKNIDIPAFKSDLKKLELQSTTLYDPDELAIAYNKVLSQILDKHAPLKRKSSVIRPLAPWYNDTIDVVRKEVRKAERTWRKTALTVHQQIFKEKRNQLTNTIKTAKKSYMQEKIKAADQSQKALFQCVDEFLYKSKVSALPTNIPAENLPNEFSNFFLKKIADIQINFTTEEDNCTQSSCQDQLNYFAEATPEEIRNIIIKSPSKSCTLDAIPTFLLKECLDEVIHIITAIINASLKTAKVPQLFKQAVVTPLLKKDSLDPDILKNYRPVSNLSFVSKILEKVVSKRLRTHKVEHGLDEPFQSAYRTGHSTETAILRVQNDILRAIDGGHCVFLVLLDLSAAFDTVSHNIILKRLTSNYGVCGRALDWIKSYLADRSQCVVVRGNYSEAATLKYGVPQGSVLGPMLFSDYSSPVAALIRSHGIAAQCYADDTQLYVSFEPSKEAETLEKLERCIEDLRGWMNRNRLKLNDSKTEFIIFGTTSKLSSILTTSVRVGDENIKAVKHVRNIGAYFDNELKMTIQVKNMCKSAWLNLYNISKIRNYLTQDQAKTLVHAYVTSKLGCK